MAQWLARGAHNSEVTRSKRVAGIYHHIAMVHQGTGANSNRCGAGVARGAHNPEVRCSNHLAGIHPLSALQKPMVIALATLNKSNLHRGSAEAARGAHNPEVVRSKRTPGIYHSQFIRTASLSLQHTIHRRGAGVARAAHNRKDIRSKRIAGIFQFAVYQNCLAVTTATFTGMAQRKRARLIISRSLVRIQLPVFIIRHLYRSWSSS